MKVRVLLLSCLFTFSVFCWIANAAEQKPLAAKVINLGVSPALRDLKPVRTLGIVGMARGREIENELVRPIAPDAFSKPQTIDPVFHGPSAVNSMPAPTVSFEGITNSDNASILGRFFVPPDTNGDVGPNHYVQMVNTLVEVFNKNGTSLAGPYKMSDLYAGTGTACEFNDDGDPVVAYDEMADRWVLSQFIFTFPSHMCIAVSTSSDPTGTYNVYDFVHLVNNLFGDYPKVGVWPDAYYVTVNNFTATTFNSAGVFAFDRSDMLAGATADYQYIDLGGAVFSTLPADVDGPTAPPGGAPEYIATYTATEFGDPSDGLRLFTLHVDFSNPGNTLLTNLGITTGAPQDPLLCGTGPCIRQQGTPQRLDSLNVMTMFRLQYRNFTTSETLVVNHTVDPDNSDRAGIRYYLLTRALPGGTFAITEQGTHRPDTNSRWMGSAAIDKDRNLAVAYSVSSTTMFPSIRYAGRLVGDPAGSLGQGENTLIAGTASQVDVNRWGDYSVLTVDPTDDCTFWFTTEYYDNPGFTWDWKTRIGSFRFGLIVSPNSVGVAINGTPYNQQLTATGSAGAFLFTIGSGALPNGLTLSSSGLISGTPNDTDGIYNFTVHVVDSLNPSACAGTADKPYQLRLGCLYCNDFETNTSPGWLEIKGTWTPTGGEYQSSGSGKAISVATPVFAGCATCTVEADLKTAGGVGNRVWLLGWYQSKAVNLELLMREEKDVWVLKHKGGTAVSKGKAKVTILPNQNYHVKVTFNGTVFQLFVDDVLLLTIPKAAGSSPNGTVGFQSKNTTGHFGSILVY